MEASAKLEAALNKVLEGDPVPHQRRLTQAEYDLRIEYVRLSWRLLSQIGPFNFREQMAGLLQAMAIGKILGDEEEAFVRKVILAIPDDMRPVNEPERANTSPSGVPVEKPE